MKTLWRALPGLALPVAIGLSLAFLATGFLPRPQPTLQPPEELRAHGVGYAEESPLRAVLERNVLKLEQPPLAPPGSPLGPPMDPAEILSALTRAPQAAPVAEGGNESQAVLAPQSNATTPASSFGAGAHGPLSGGSSVQGSVAQPKAAAPAKP